MSSPFKAADIVRNTLGLDPLSPSYTIISYAVVEKTTGKLCACGNSSGQLVLPNGIAVTGSTLTDLSGSTGGLKLGGPLLLSAVDTPVAATGSTKTDAAPLTTATIQKVSSDSAAKGWILPLGVPGMQIFLINTTATAGKIYPDAGGTINGGSADANVTVLASKGNLCECTAASTWTLFDTAAKSA